MRRIQFAIVPAALVLLALLFAVIMPPAPLVAQVPMSALQTSLGTANFINAPVAANGLIVPGNPTTDAAQTNQGGAIKAIYTGQAVLTPGSVGAVAVVSVTMTVTGAVVANSFVSCAPQATLTTAVSHWEFVSAANVVTVAFANASAGALVPTAQTWRCTVFQY